MAQSHYNFKRIQIVTGSTALIDVVLSKTQRKTPTEIHRHFAISRIRAFYTRKVKYAQQSFHDKLTRIVDDFPHFDSLHPFYADLFNVLYDRDHYKLALGQLAHARSLIDGIARDYVRMLKYGDSLYRCKQLKKAALGRMCTLIKRHSSSLAYLEQVRQHMARLPSIDPTARTLLIAGFPNVGKSSFLNIVSRADVEVQPYAFTTKSLFIGHTDHAYLRWQVIDTPGILDHALDERNTIEMQSITALAHLRAAVLFFVDPSESCGYTLKQQHSLFRNVAPLFATKPLIVVANKTDLGWEQELTPDTEALLADFTSPVATVPAPGEDMLPAEPVSQRAADALLKTSARDATGIAAVKRTACELLLAQRVDAKVKSRKAQAVLNRLHLAQPMGGDQTNPERPPTIPASVRAKRAAAAATAEASHVSDDDAPFQRRLAGKPGARIDSRAEDDDDEAMEGSSRRRLERDLEAEAGGPGVYSMDYRKLYDLKRPAWAYDIIPEIVDGKNVADFVDADIEAKLAALEAEEDARTAVGQVEYASEAVLDGYRALTDEERATVAMIRDRKQLLRASSAREQQRGRMSVSRNSGARKGLDLENFRGHLQTLGLDSADVEELTEKVRGRSRGRSRGPRSRASSERGSGAVVVGSKRNRSASAVPATGADAGGRSNSRSVSVGPRASKRIRVGSTSGIRDVFHAKKAEKTARAKTEKRIRRDARKGEGDRHIFDEKPKHMIVGKRGVGKTSRR
ncbi:hypothetical protein MMPV_000779 [Pyropia vietnamensis]